MTPKSSVCLIHTGSSSKLRGRICGFLVQNYCLIFCWVGRRSSLGSQQRGTKSSLTLTCSQWYLRQGSLKTFLWKITMCTLKSCADISQEFFPPLVSYSLSFLCPFLTTISFCCLPKGWRDGKNQVEEDWGERTFWPSEQVNHSMIGKNK